MERRGGLCSTIQNCLNVFQGKVTANEVFSFNYTEKCLITAEIIIQRSKNHSDPGKSASLCLYSGTKIDPSKFYLREMLLSKQKQLLPEKNEALSCWIMLWQW